MPSTKQIKRLLRLISILQSGRFVNTREIADECGITRRTVFRDIEKLRESGFRIIYDEKKMGFQLQESRFLVPTDLTTEEVLALITICQDLADSQTGVSYLEPARTAAFKLISVLPRKMRKYIGEMVELRHVRIGPTADLDGTKQLFEIASEALEEKESLLVRYRSFTEQAAISTRLDPYCFFFSRRSWYLIGYSAIHKEVRTFHMKRFEKMERLPEKKYKIPARFSLDKYLGNAWNMIREKDNPFHVVIKFSPMVAGNVSEIQWHKTQKIEPLEEGGVLFRADVEGLNEIIWWVLGYGKQAEVLEPQELREKLLEHAQALVAQYQ